DFQALLRQARAGDRDALGRLLLTCHARLLRAAERQLPTDLRAKADAADLVQETLAAAFQAFPRFPGQTDADLRAWLFAILQNQRVNLERHYRYGARRQVGRELSWSAEDDATLPSDEDSPATVLGRRESAAAVHAAVARLPDASRRVIQLHFFAGLDF